MVMIAEEIPPIRPSSASTVELGREVATPAESESGLPKTGNIEYIYGTRVVDINTDDKVIGDHHPCLIFSPLIPGSSTC